MGYTQEFIKKNLLTLLVYLVLLAVAWGNLNTRVNAMSEEHETIDRHLEKIDSALVELVRLQEKTVNLEKDVTEIKGDIKDIKVHFEIK